MPAFSAPPVVTCDEIREHDLADAIALRNTCFAPINLAGWQSEPALTACVSRQAGEIVGVLPLALRHMDIGAGRTITAAFEHSVCTRADQRGRGVGTQMIESARTWLRGRADALFVYRTREDSAGYRFYEKTGHADLLYARRHVLASPSGGTIDPGVRIIAGLEAIVAAEEDCLALRQRELGHLAGSRVREPGFFARALRGFYFAAHPQEFSLVRVEREARLAAYALLGLPRLAQDLAVLNVLEFVASQMNDAHVLLRAVAQLAHQKRRPVHCVTSDSHPLLPALGRAGYMAEPRHQMLMAQLLDPSAWAAQVWRQVSALEHVRVVAWTPSGEFVLHAPTSPLRTLRLEMKLPTLTRLLLGRVQMGAALEMETITATGMEPADAHALAQALPFAPWCYHGIDYL